MSTSTLFDQRAEALEHRAERLLEQAARMREIAEKADEILELLRDLEPDNVIFFRKRFQGHGPAYTYGAVKYDRNGATRWSTTGPLSPKDYTTEEFGRWLVDNHGVEELWIPESYEQVL